MFRSALRKVTQNEKRGNEFAAMICLLAHPRTLGFALAPRESVSFALARTAGFCFALPRTAGFIVVAVIAVFGDVVVIEVTVAAAIAPIDIPCKFTTIAAVNVTTALVVLPSSFTTAGTTAGSTAADFAPGLTAAVAARHSSILRPG